MKRVLWATIVAVSLSACDQTVRSPLAVNADPNASPDKIANGPGKVSKSQLDPTKSVFTFGPELGHATVTNTTDTTDIFTFIVWRADDPVNQVDVAHDTVTLTPGASFTFGVGLAVGPCNVYQPDIYKGLPQAQRYTMSDVGNYLFAGGGLVGPASHCRNPPDPKCTDCGPKTTCIGCETLPPVCSALSFASFTLHVDGETVVEDMVVNPGYEGITAFLISYGVPTYRRGDGDLPLPQTGVLVTKTLVVGPNRMTAPLASSQVYAGFQAEWGCYTDSNRPPLVLTEENLRSFVYLDSGWGNFEGSHQ